MSHSWGGGFFICRKGKEKTMKNIRKIAALVLTLTLLLGLSACGGSEKKADYTIGICNYVSDASLDQIVENVKSGIQAAAEAKGIKVEILEQNANADAALMEQIISNFIAEKVDVMVGVATPVAVRMQALAEGSDIPVVFAAVSDPVGAGLVETMAAPGGNITGTSDGLNAEALINLLTATVKDCEKVALLYDLGQDSSTAAIASAKEVLSGRGIAFADYTGTTTDELLLAVDALIADGCDAVFTPTDNTVMTAELAIYEKLADSGVPHFAGADSFALNGALLGYGVNYALLGQETAALVMEILNGAKAATTPVRTFDNGIATVNTEVCALLGLDYDTLAAAYGDYCSAVQPITTAESFN